MAKKTKDETVDFLYINKKETSNQTKQKNKNVPKKPVNKKNMINLDNEIIIGLTPKPEKKQPKKQEKNKKTKSKKKINKKIVKKKNPIPKIKKKKTIKMVIVKWSSLAIIAIGILILLALSPLFNIKQVNIVNITKNEGGEYKVLEEEISGIVDIPDTQNIFKLDYKEIIAKIKNSNTYIENVEIKKELPNAITITIEERKPRYIIEIEDKNVYIDSKGNILEISETKIDVPKIVGYETSIENIIDYKNTKVLSENDCKKLERVNQVYDAAKNNGILYCVTSIDITKIDDIKLILEEEYKTVYLGDCSNANLRILYLKTMIEKETGKEGEAFINGDMRTLTPKPYFREKV